MQTGIEFEPITQEKKEWKVTLKWNGEGLHGKYVQENDEDGDIPMLCLTIEQKINKNWSQKCSQQTFLRATDDRDLLEEAVNLVLDRVLGCKERDRFFYEKLSYVHLHGKEVRIDLPNGSDKDD